VNTNSETRDTYARPATRRPETGAERRNRTCFRSVLEPSFDRTRDPDL
jgi:hypothetical protein